MTLKELLAAVASGKLSADKAEVQLASASKLAALMRDNRTFKYMRVKPTRMTKTPAYPTNIWARCEYFKPVGRGTAK